MNEPYFWQKIGVIEALDLGPDKACCVEGSLTVWKLLENGTHGGLYAIGRTKETAIVTRNHDWNMVQAVIKTDQDGEDKWREHIAAVRGR